MRAPAYADITSDAGAAEASIANHVVEGSPALVPEHDAIKFGVPTGN